MKHKIQITMEYETEDMDHDGRTPSASRILVKLDDEPIGLIQDLKFQVSVDDLNSPRLDITFPNMFGPDYQYSSLSKDLEQRLQKLSVPALRNNVRIFLRSITTGIDSLFKPSP